MDMDWDLEFEVVRAEDHCHCKSWITIGFVFEPFATAANFSIDTGSRYANLCYR